ncbi:MAG: YgdI/YgdR family lipoprotein [Desulfobulbaceae bacterium]|jgi:hypothetical protein|nr:YgdI/YgdR family lipoprotein [Desulfobulbaceae bacterium]
MAIAEFSKKLVMAAVACALLATVGCSSKSAQTTDDGLATPATVGAMAANFKDIEMPVEMKWDTAESITVNTSSFQGGIAKYAGRVEINSLRDFLLSSMANNKWKMVGDTQYADKIILAFTKPARTCLIALEDGGFFSSTYATLYVTSDLATGTRTNPFGEPIR